MGVILCIDLIRASLNAFLPRSFGSSESAIVSQGLGILLFDGILLTLEKVFMHHFIRN